MGMDGFSAYSSAISYCSTTGEYICQTVHGIVHRLGEQPIEQLGAKYQITMAELLKFVLAERSSHFCHVLGILRCGS